ncbi:MAG: hypothetical protein D6713_07285 [Deltaproteobacteria bacterium]|nr:MAG: hypothetical protein D6713_07285 [Deltaproteobacteria bacterium]
MDLLEGLRTRRTVRKFRDERIPREVVEEIVRLGTLAPNAGNAQSWRFIVIDDKGALLEMKKIVDGVIGSLTGEEIPPEKFTYQNLFARAPVAVAAVSRPYESGTDRLLKEKAPDRYRIRQKEVNPSLQSVSAAILQMCLAAHAMGIGSCWMTGPLTARPELEEYLGIEPPEELVALLALGYPEKVPQAPPRKDLTEVLTYFGG